MNNAGITTQYGFLFQRKAFILFALENAGTKQTFTFEGRDDIEISADESIYSVKSADASYIQVKSGTISESCFCKVICNWLLFDKESSGTVTLFAENQLDTLVSNITKDIIFDYIIQGKEKKRSSIAWKTYNKFQNPIETDREAFLGIIEKFLQIINIHICSMDELDSRLEKVFFENYCRDITEYQLAKSKRLERFISYMNQEIDNALKAQRPCTLLFADLMKMIMTVCDEISDHRYIAKIPELKKRAKSEATQLVKDNAIREVRQLYLVDKHDQEFNRSLFQAKKLFRELHLTYTSDFTKDYATFLKFKNSYTRTAKSKSKDLVSSLYLAVKLILTDFMNLKLKRLN